MELITGIIGLFVLFLWAVAFTRLGQIRDEAQKQTRLLEQIARNTQSPDAAVKSAPAQDYMREDTATGLKFFLFVIGTIAVVLFIVAIASHA